MLGFPRAIKFYILLTQLNIWHFLITGINTYPKKYRLDFLFNFIMYRFRRWCWSRKNVFIRIKLRVLVWVIRKYKNFLKKMSTFLKRIKVLSSVDAILFFRCRALKLGITGHIASLFFYFKIAGFNLVTLSCLLKPVFITN